MEETKGPVFDFGVSAAHLYTALEKRDMLNFFMSNHDKISSITFTLEEHTLTVPLLHDKERRIFEACSHIRDVLRILSDMQVEEVKEKVQLVEQHILQIKEKANE